MKKIVISTFLREAIPSDIFDKEGSGLILEEKQIFYKEADGNFYGPYRLQCIQCSPAYSMEREELILYLKNQEIQHKKAAAEVIELWQLLEQKRIYIVDPFQYLESFSIYLKVKLVAESDILQNKHLIVNTAYFKKKLHTINGPFYINKNHNLADFKALIGTKKMYVFDHPGLIKTQI